MPYTRLKQMQDIIMPSRAASKSHHLSYFLLHPACFYRGCFLPRHRVSMRTAQPVAVTPVSRSQTRNESAAAAASARGICGWDLLSNSPLRSSAWIHTDSRLSNCGILTEIKNKKLGESLKAACQTERGTNTLLA